MKTWPQRLSAVVLSSLALISLSVPEISRAFNPSLDTEDGAPCCGAAFQAGFKSYEIQKLLQSQQSLVSGLTQGMEKIARPSSELRERLSQFGYNVEGGHCLVSHALSVAKSRQAAYIKIFGKEVEGRGLGLCLSAVDESIAHWLPEQSEKGYKEELSHDNKTGRITKTSSTRFLRGAGSAYLAAQYFRSQTARQFFTEISVQNSSELRAIFCQVPGAVVVWGKERTETGEENPKSNGHAAISDGKCDQIFDSVIWIGSPWSTELLTSNPDNFSVFLPTTLGDCNPDPEN